MDEDSDGFDDVSDADALLYDDEDDDEQDAEGATAFAAEDDDTFTQDALGKGKAKNYEVEYVCRTIEDLQHKQKQEVDHVAGMFVVKVSSRFTRSPMAFSLVLNPATPL